MGQVLKKNEVDGVHIELWDDHTGDSVTVDSATFEVFDSDDTTVQASANATITDNSTATPDISGEVDTTVAGFVVDDEYLVQFVVTIGTVVKRPCVPIEIATELLSRMPLQA